MSRWLLMLISITLYLYCISSLALIINLDTIVGPWPWQRHVTEKRQGSWRFSFSIFLKILISTFQWFLQHKIEEHRGVIVLFFINGNTKRTFYIVSFFLLCYNGIYYTIRTLRRYYYHNYYYNFQTKPILLSRSILSVVRRELLAL